MKNVFLGLLLLILKPFRSQTGSAFKMGTDAFEKGIRKSDIQILHVRTAAYAVIELHDDGSSKRTMMKYE